MSIILECLGSYLFMQFCSCIYTVLYMGVCVCVCVFCVFCVCVCVRVHEYIPVVEETPCRKYWKKCFTILTVLFSTKHSREKKSDEVLLQYRRKRFVSHSERRLFSSHFEAEQFLSPARRLSSVVLCSCVFRELRALVVEMVLATDMSCHFQQVKAMKNFLQLPEGWETFTANIRHVSLLSVTSCLIRVSPEQHVIV